MDPYVVFGNPIEHSLSPQIHALFAKQTGQQISYDKQLAPLDDFAGSVTSFIENGGKGANVTLPFKEQAFQLATKKSQDAIDARAVNVLVFHDNGIIEGCNTDGMGLVQDITHNHHHSLRQKRILVLGAGGAVHGIIGALLHQAPEQLVIANRTKEKADALAEQFRMIGTIESSTIDALEGPYDLILNGTSVREGEMFALPEGLVASHTWCYDLNYNVHHQTAFLKWALAKGAGHILDGIGMLVEQAAASFYIWRGVYPDTKSVLEQLLSE